MPGEISELTWPEAKREMNERRCRCVVLGEMFVAGPQPLPPEFWRDEISPSYVVRATYGEGGPPPWPAPPRPFGELKWVWHGNRQRIYAFELHVAAQSGPSFPCTAAWREQTAVLLRAAGRAAFPALGERDPRGRPLVD